MKDMIDDKRESKIEPIDPKSNEDNNTTPEKNSTSGREPMEKEQKITNCVSLILLAIAVIFTNLTFILLAAFTGFSGVWIALFCSCSIISVGIACAINRKEICFNRRITVICMIVIEMITIAIYLTIALFKNADAYIMLLFISLIYLILSMGLRKSFKSSRR